MTRMTDEHFEIFRKAAGEHVELDRDDCRLILRGLVEAGIELTLPVPPYFVTTGGTEARVWKRVPGGRRSVAAFDLDHHPDARCAAQAECDRLNRE